MPVNPCLTEKDLSTVNVNFLDELRSICSVLRDIAGCNDEMPQGVYCVLMWCADSIEKRNAVLGKFIKAKL